MARRARRGQGRRGARACLARRALGRRLSRQVSDARRRDMPADMDRRRFLFAAAVLAAGPGLRGHAEAENPRTRLILLGTGGGPRPRKTSSASAQVIVANDTAYVVDCGNGVARQLAFAGVPLAK